MSSPWMKFYPSDWRADPALRMCSIGARGLWMEMLCIMHEAVPRGSLLVNGRQITDRQLAGLAGISPEEAGGYLSELEDAGVFSREDDGTIFSRRIRRDEEKAERDKANGRRGGSPLLKGVNPPDNPPGGRGDKAQKPEARVQKPDATNERSPSSNGRSSSAARDQDSSTKNGVRSCRSPEPAAPTRPNGRTPDEPEYSPDEIAELQLEFDAIDVAATILELLEWCDEKGIIKANERKKAVYGGLKKRQAKRAEVRAITGGQTGPPSERSPELLAAIQRRGWGKRR